MDTLGITLRDRRNKGWFWASNAIWNANLTPRAKLVYLLLCRLAEDKGHCFPSLKYIEQKTGIGHVNVGRALLELEGFGPEDDTSSMDPVGPAFIRRHREYGKVTRYDVFDVPETQTPGVWVRKAPTDRDLATQTAGIRSPQIPAIRSTQTPPIHEVDLDRKEALDPKKTFASVLRTSATPGSGLPGV